MNLSQVLTDARSYHIGRIAYYESALTPCLDLIKPHRDALLEIDRSLALLSYEPRRAEAGQDGWGIRNGRIYQCMWSASRKGWLRIIPPGMVVGRPDCKPIYATMPDAVIARWQAKGNDFEQSSSAALEALEKVRNG